MQTVKDAKLGNTLLRKYVKKKKRPNVWLDRLVLACVEEIRYMTDRFPSHLTGS